MWHCGPYRLDLEQRPLIMGILNVTPDSFSDGYPGTALALAQAERLIEDGADILDIGGESTRPGSDSITTEEELARVLPVIEALAGRQIPLSIDTQKVDVARAAVAAGAVIINHVSATLDHGAMLPLLRECDAGYVAMHMRERPKTMQHKPRYTDVMAEVVSALRRVHADLHAAGVADNRLVFDPGIGFGKKLAHNLTLMGSVETLRRQLGLPLLMGLSRKSWLHHLLAADMGDNAALDAYSLVASLSLPFPAVAIHRVHNVKLLHNGFALRRALSP